MLSVISRLTSCAALLCRACGNLTACVAERYLTLRTGYEKHGRKNPLPYPISERSHVGNLRQIRKQGKGRSSKRKGNRRCPFLFELRRGCGESPRSAERSSPLRFSEKLSARQGRTRLRQFVCPAQPMQKRSRPDRANPPAAVRVPRSADAEKEPPIRVEPACGSSCAPVSRCSKRSRPSGSNPPAAVRVPRSADAEKEPPVRVEPACGRSCAPVSRCSKRGRPSGANLPAAVRVPRSPCAEKRKAPQNCFRGAQSMHFYSNRSSVSTSLRAGACGSCAG